jgi:hypothetical protein
MSGNLRLVQEVRAIGSQSHNEFEPFKTNEQDHRLLGTILMRRDIRGLFRRRLKRSLLELSDNRCSCMSDHIQISVFNSSTPQLFHLQLPASKFLQLHLDRV